MRMALQEIERGLLHSQPERFARERSRRKALGYRIAAGVLLLAAIAGTASLPAFWAHFSGMVQTGYDPVRPFRGAGMGFAGVVMGLVFLWLFGLLFAHAAVFRAHDWVEPADSGTHLNPLPLAGWVFHAFNRSACHATCSAMKVEMK